MRADTASVLAGFKGCTQDPCGEASSREEAYGARARGPGDTLFSCK